MHSTLLKTIVLLALTSLSVADLHTRAVCIKNIDGNNVYDSGATDTSCRYYKNRHSGSNQWDTCPDCHMVYGDDPHCLSSDGHIGGDEITYYCKMNGADNALTS